VPHALPSLVPGLLVVPAPVSPARAGHVAATSTWLSSGGESEYLI